MYIHVVPERNARLSLKGEIYIEIFQMMTFLLGIELCQSCLVFRSQTVASWRPTVRDGGNYSYRYN